MFIWLVILINSLLLYTVVMWVNVGKRGTVVKNGKNAVYNTHSDSATSKIVTLQCQQKFWKRVVLGCSNPHIAGVPSICVVHAWQLIQQHGDITLFRWCYNSVEFLSPTTTLLSHSVSACPPHCCRPLLSLYLDPVAQPSWDTLGHVPKQLRIVPNQCSCACQLSTPIVQLSSANWAANYPHNLALKIKNHSVATCI